MKKIKIIYSSITGNTKKVAESVFDFLNVSYRKDKNIKNDKESQLPDKIAGKDKGVHTLSYGEKLRLPHTAKLELFDIKNFTGAHYGADKENNRIFCDFFSDDDIIIICFWCRRSGMDDLSLSLIESLSNKKILAIGTLSGDAKGQYGYRVKENAKNAISHNNQCIGVHLCQGHSNLKRIESRRHLNPGEPKYISPEKWLRHLNMQHHPDANDIKEVLRFVQCTLLHYFK